MGLVPEGGDFEDFCAFHGENGLNAINFNVFYFVFNIFLLKDNLNIAVFNKKTAPLGHLAVTLTGKEVSRGPLNCTPFALLKGAISGANLKRKKGTGDPVFLSCGRIK